jgi:hypothetical protein
MRWKNMLGAGDVAAAIVLVAIVLGLQLLSGAYQADFDSTPDEPAHVVSSLMVRDHLASGSVAHPWEFAKTYYIHYPKVAILHWPPLFHFCEAIWMLAAGRSRAGLLSFQGSAGSALALSVFFWLRREHGFWIAFLSAIVSATTRLVQSAASAVAPDLLLGLFVFWDAAAYARYVATGNRRYAWWSALFGLGALGVHGRAAILLMVPIMTLLLLRVTAIRIAAAMLVVLVYISLPSFLSQAYPSSPMGVLKNSGEYFAWLESALRWPVCLLALMGIAAAFRVRERKSGMTVMIALVLSCWIFHSAVNVPIQETFLITVAPAMIVLAAGGASALWHGLAAAPSWRRPGAIALVVLSLWVAGSNMFGPPVKESLGARRIVESNLLYLDPQKIWLVAGTATFEGALIAETALRDTAKDHIVLRASKMLAWSTWAGAYYRLLFQDQSSVSGFLDEAHVGWVIAQGSESVPHIRQLEATLRARTRSWQSVTPSSSPQGVTLFKRSEPLAGSPKIDALEAGLHIPSL